MEVIGISSGGAGLISLGITICKGLLEYYDSYVDAEIHVAQMYASIQALAKTLKLLQTAIQDDAFDSDIVDRVEGCIRSVSKGFQSLEKKLNKVRLVPLHDGWKARTQSQFRRTLFPFKESTLLKLKELGSELRADLSLALDVLQVDASAATLQKLDLFGQTLTDVATNVDIIRENSKATSVNLEDVRLSTLTTSDSVRKIVGVHSEERKRQVCEWLSPLSAEFQRKQVDTFNTQNRQDGALQQFLETSEFRDWLGTCGANLWCPGIRESFSNLSS